MPSFLCFLTVAAFGSGSFFFFYCRDLRCLTNLFKEIVSYLKILEKLCRFCKLYWCLILCLEVSLQIRQSLLHQVIFMLGLTLVLQLLSHLLFKFFLLALTNCSLRVVSSCSSILAGQLLLTLRNYISNFNLEDMVPWIEHL